MAEISLRAGVGMATLYALSRGAVSSSRRSNPDEVEGVIAGFATVEGDSPGARFGRGCGGSCVLGGQAPCRARAAHASVDGAGAMARRQRARVLRPAALLTAARRAASPRRAHAREILDMIIDQRPESGERGVSPSRSSRPRSPAAPGS